jgi:hypothetical protein
MHERNSDSSLGPTADGFGLIGGSPPAACLLGKFRLTFVSIFA